MYMYTHTPPRTYTYAHVCMSMYCSMSVCRLYVCTCGFTFGFVHECM